MNKSKRVTLLLSATLVGATMAHSVQAASPADGVVIASKKITHVRNNNTHPVKHYTTAGGTIGLLSGAAVGGIVGGPIGLAVGPAVYGILGAGFGAATGVLSSALNPAQVIKYQYKVKSLSDSKIYTVSQGATPISLNSNVRIIHRNNKLLIRSC